LLPSALLQQQLWLCGSELCRPDLCRPHADLRRCSFLWLR
jgi:hypothetical protein